MTAPTAVGRRPDPSSSVLAAQRELDARLFASHGWFAIDSANRKVPGVTPATLDQALALVGHGKVATIVGRLRPDIAGIDVDAAGALGDTAAQTLRDWCAARGLWHLLRASGGGPGRWHVLVVPGVHRNELAALVDRLRHELRLTGRHLDLRDHLRPLSAPHRRHGATTPPHGIHDALTGLQAVLQPVPDRVQANRSELRRVARPGAGGPVAPLPPLPRPRRDLPAPWTAYLACGRPAAGEVDRDPATRSQIELEATTALVLAGYSEPEAWTAITSAHRSAFTKARDRGRRWWWNVWNRCVLDADRWLTARRSASRTTRPPQAATQNARASLEATWLFWPTRTRHVDHEVLTVVLDRMDRIGAAEAAVPQRDLVLDCAVASRTTVRAALHRLQAAGLLQVLPTYQPGTTDTSHTLRLPQRFTASSNTRDGAAVSPTDPPRYQPPLRVAPLPLRRALGLPACALLAYLPAQASTPLAALALAAGLLPPGQTEPTLRQIRTVRQHLQTLARHGLAVVDEHGNWRVGPVAVDTAIGGVLGRVGQQLDDAALVRVALDRAKFRERIDGDARKARWERRRRAVLAQQAKDARARQRVWWHALPTASRERRRTAGSDAFRALPIAEQARRKQQLAEHRTRAGERESQRYHSWLGGLHPDELAERSIQRAAAFARRPADEQQQIAATWAEHRARWRLPHHRRQADPVPKPTARDQELPEAHLLRRQPPTVDELVLFDIEETRRTAGTTTAAAVGIGA